MVPCERSLRHLWGVSMLAPQRVLPHHCSIISSSSSTDILIAVECTWNEHAPGDIIAGACVDQSSARCCKADT